MELNMIRAFVIAGVLLLGSSAALAQSRINLTLPKVNPFDEMLPVNFCEVIQNAQRYDGKIIRVRAIFWQNFEGAELLPYDSVGCDGMRAVRDCEADDCEELNKLLFQKVGGTAFGGSAVLVVGRFKYRKVITGDQLRYGIRPYELRISEVQEVFLKLPERTNQKH